MKEEIRLQSLDALQKAVKIIGSKNKLAKQIGVDPQLITMWEKRNKCGVTAAYVIPIEEITNGKVTRHELRPDIYPKE